MVGQLTAGVNHRPAAPPWPIPPGGAVLLAQCRVVDILDFTATAQVATGSVTIPTGQSISSAPRDTSYPTYQLGESGREDISKQNRQVIGGTGGS